jgi:hypothetical protein
MRACVQRPHLLLFGGMLGWLKTVAPLAFTSMNAQVSPASVLRLATHGMPAAARTHAHASVSTSCDKQGSRV